MFPGIPPRGASTLEKLEEALSPAKLDLPARPEVVALRFEPSKFVSEDALRVWVIVPDETPEECLDVAHLRPIRDRIEEAFEDKELALIPLPKFRTVSEYEDETGEQL